MTPEVPGSLPGLPEQNPEVRKTLPPHFAAKDHMTDTAGIPWKGRDYSVSPFPTDTGDRSPVLAAALERLDAGADASREGIVAALSGQRVLIPIQAIATDTAVTASGHHADNASDMAMVKLQLSESEVALPVFTSVAALSAWNPQARPVPMVVEQAAQSAVAEGCTSLVVDLGRAQPILLSRSALWALAQGRQWMLPHRDGELQRAIADLSERHPALHEAVLEPGERTEAELQLALEPGLTREELERVLGAIQQDLAHMEIVAERVSSLKLTLRAARLP